MHEIRFFLNIPAERFVEYYRGVRQVQTTSVDGRRIQFPANILQPYVTREGVHGEFVLQHDDRHRLIALKRIGDLPR